MGTVQGSPRSSQWWLVVEGYGQGAPGWVAVVAVAEGCCFGVSQVDKGKSM